MSWLAPLRGFIGDLHARIRDDNIFNGAAALAYYFTLAIFPAFIVLTTLIAYLPIAHVDEAIMDMLKQALPQSASQMFSGVVEQVTSERRGGLLSLSIVGTMWAMSSGMYGLMQQLNVTYEAPEARGFVKGRATALALSVLFLVLVIGASSLVVMGGMIQQWLGDRFGFSDALLAFFASLRWLIIVASLVVGFSLVYRLGPNVRRRVRWISPGSVVGVALLMAGSLAFSLYASHFGNYDAIYGSIGAVILLMLWLYVAALAILLGSEIDELLARRKRGSDGAGARAA